MQQGSRQLVVSLIVACAMFMQNLDSTIIATALPAIGESLGENPLRLNVAITCYLLSLAVFIPISGWTADRFGARRVFTGAIIVFTLGSIACGLSQSLPQLVAARVLQGLGGGGLMTLSQALIGELVPPRERIRFQGYFALMFTCASIGGPVIGGFVVSHTSWRWLFFANLPFAAFAACRH